jgi:GNAT superfamily N-acetyltransferase
VTITTRAATESDLPALLALYAELHPDDPPLTEDAALRTWHAIDGQAGRTILVAELADAVVGTVDCSVLPNLTRGAAPFLLIENVVVDAAHRRRGVGARLMGAAVALARSAGCYKAQLLSATSRADAHAFYESGGFRPTAAGYRLYLNRSPQ